MCWQEHLRCSSGTWKSPFSPTICSSSSSRQLVNPQERLRWPCFEISCLSCHDQTMTHSSTCSGIFWRWQSTATKTACTSKTWPSCLGQHCCHQVRSPETWLWTWCNRTRSSSSSCSSSTSCFLEHCSCSSSYSQRAGKLTPAVFSSYCYYCSCAAALWSWHVEQPLKFQNSACTVQAKEECCALVNTPVNSWPFLPPGWRLLLSIIGHMTTEQFRAHSGRRPAKTQLEVADTVLILCPINGDIASCLPLGAMVPSNCCKTVLWSLRMHAHRPSAVMAMVPPSWLALPSSFTVFSKPV